MLLRSSETLLVAYFLYTAVLAVVLPISRTITAITLVLNLTVLTGLLLLAHADSLRRREFLSIVRDWYPAPLMLLAYREMGWFARPHPNINLERAWVVWDKMFLNDWGVKAAIESTGPLLPSMLEISYSLVYTIAPFSLAMLYVYHRRERVNAFLFTFLTGVLFAYALFPYFPSEPPRTVFPGQDSPSIETIFRRFNWWLLGGYGIHTSVFPSAHVSGAFSGAFAMTRLLPEKKWVGRALVVLAVLIATATVYGRYHYLVDALAGLLVALIAEGVSRRFYRNV
jgi:membrane-associated phospholipid phosphatase